MNLSKKQIQHLRTMAHSLKPVVLLGTNGLTEAVMAEVDLALSHHELIKVKVVAEDRETKQLIIDAIIRESGAAKIQTIGHILALYKPAAQPKIILPRG